MEYLIEILKKEYILTRIMMRVLIKIIKGKNTNLKKFAKYQIFNSLKMLVIFIIFMFPMGSWIIVAMVFLKFKLGINLLPNAFNKEKYLISLKKYKNK